MKPAIFAGVCAGLLTFSSFTAYAATISGKITRPTNVNLPGMEVRLWTVVGKGWAVQTRTTSAADGTYSFTSVAEGEYRVDVRMPDGYSGNYGDVWYDQAMPMSNGLVGADADTLDVGAADVLTGINMEMFLGGGLDVTVGLGGLALRAESATDPRIHHNDLSRSTSFMNPQGRSSFRGLAPSSLVGDYFLLVYDRQGFYNTFVAGPAVTVAAGGTANKSVTLQQMPADPYEPNNSATDAATPTIAQWPFASSGATFSTSNDPDYYCFDAQAGDRFVARAYGRITVNGVDRRHPWLDPMIGLWDGTQFIDTNDDAIPGQTWDAELDTRALAAGGRYCFVVTTFGDANFVGTGQLSKGEYVFEMERGNRTPTLEVLYGGVVAPVAPAEIAVDEGVPMQFTMNFSDPDMDVLSVEVRHMDTNGTDVTTGTLTEMANSATYDWTPSQTDAALSPFTLTFRINDGEFDLRVPVLVRVAAQSVPPPVPVLLEPIDDAVVATPDLDLVLENAVDPDGDALSYEFEVEYGEPDGTPEHEATETEDASGQTATALTMVPEDTWVSWRARAFDGADYSAWSDWERFFLSAGNNPPDAPVVIKPTANAQLAERQPTIAVTIPSDPEGDPVLVTIELATDGEFGSIVATSDPLEPGTDEMMLSWLVPDLLDFGGVYYVRASAVDDKDARGDYSETVAFSIRFENELESPALSGDWANCGVEAVDAFPTEVAILNLDNSGDAITYEVRIARAESPEEPLVQGSAPQSAGIETNVTLDAVDAGPGEYVLSVRAIRGDETTDWVGCPFRIGGGPDGGDGDDGDTTGGREGGCGCASTDGSAGSLFLLVLGFGLLRRRRVRGSSPR